MSRSNTSNHPVRFPIVSLLLAGWFVVAQGMSERTLRFGPGVRINALHRGSDGSLLGAGWATNLDWIPAGTARKSLQATRVESRDTSGQAILVKWSADLDSILWVAAFPKGTVGPLRKLRASGSSAPLLDSIWLSGDRTVSDPLRDGYFVASLASGASNSPSVAWTFDVLCPPRRAGGRQGASQYKTVQAWDVDPKSSVWIARGAEADFDSAEVVRLDAHGKLTLVEEWSSHVTSRGRVWRGRPSSYTSLAGQTDTLLYSRLLLKSTEAQSPRSRQRFLASGGVATAVDSDQTQLWTSNGAGGLMRGSQPLDILFSGPCREYYHDLAVQFPDSTRCPSGRGWSGLAASSRATARIGGLIVERESMRWAVGLTWNALGADGSPLDIPTVMAFDSEGKSLWWSRLRDDALRDSSPKPMAGSLSEIDAMGVGLNQSTTGPVLVVGARAREAGAFWAPGLASKGAGWRSSLDGLPDQGQEASWLGVLTLVDGQFLSSTWQAAPAAGSTGAPLADPFYRGWPTPGTSGEILGSTRCPRVDLDASGNILTVCRGDRPLTTPGARGAVAPPGQPGPTGWSVVGSWEPTLKSPLWATALDGERIAGDSGAGLQIDDQLVLPDGGVLAVGHPLRAGFRLASLSAPGWSSSTNGDVVLAVVPARARTGASPHPTRIGAIPRLLRSGDLVRVRTFRPEAGTCSWVGPSGREGDRVALVGGEAVLRLPEGSGIRFLRIHQGGMTWVLPCPVLR